MTEDSDLISQLQKKIEEYEEMAEAYTKKAETLRIAMDEVASEAVPLSVPSDFGDTPSLEGLTIADAVTTVLHKAENPLHTNEILKRLESDGKSVTINGLRGVLYGRDNKGRFDRVGKGMWGLSLKSLVNLLPLYAPSVSTKVPIPSTTGSLADELIKLPSVQLRDLTSASGLAQKLIESPSARLRDLTSASELAQQLTKLPSSQLRDLTSAADLAQQLIKSPTTQLPDPDSPSQRLEPSSD